MMSGDVSVATELQAGGDLRSSSIYIQRPADSAVPRLLREAGLCWVFAPRQIGKSSLARRVLADLRADGFLAAHVDLSVLGAGTPGLEQWLYGLCFEIGRAVGQPEETLLSWWTRQSVLGPAVRFLRWVQSVRPPAGQPPLVLLLDEIDALISVGFPRESVFAALRALHNEGGLGLCLLGVSTPAELISDPAATPFNSGVEVRLDDFEREEMAGFLPGLSALGDQAEAALDAVWAQTSGHPYMSQRLLVELLELREGAAEQGSVQEQVAALAERIFVRPTGHHDACIAAVEQRLRAAPSQLAGDALRRYQPMISADERPLTSGEPPDLLLRLAGLAVELRSPEGPRLEPRNRVTAAAFDAAWAARRMAELSPPTPRPEPPPVVHVVKPPKQTGPPPPRFRPPADDAPARPLQSVRLMPVVLMTGALVVVAAATAIYRSKHPPEVDPQVARASAQAAATLAAAVPDLLTTRGVPAAAESALAAAALTKDWTKDADLRAAIGRVSAAAGRVRHPLSAPSTAVGWLGEDLLVGQADGAVLRLRGDHAQTLGALEGAVDCVAGWGDGILAVQDRTMRAFVLEIPAGLGEPDGRCAGQSADGSALIYVDTSNNLKVDNIDASATVSSFVETSGPGPLSRRPLAALSSAGPGLYASGASAAILGFPGLRFDALMSGHTAAIVAGALSPDGRFAATAAIDGTVRLWDARTGGALTILCGLPGGSQDLGLAFSPGGALAIAGPDGVRVWAAGTGSARWTQKVSRAAALDLVDGVVLVREGEALSRLDLETGQPSSGAEPTIAPASAAIAFHGEEPATVTGPFGAVALAGHGHLVAVDLSADGRVALTAGKDGNARLWDSATGAELERFRDPGGPLVTATLSADGRDVVTLNEDGQLRAWRAVAAPAPADPQGYLDRLCGLLPSAVCAPEGAIQ